MKRLYYYFFLVWLGWACGAADSEKREQESLTKGRIRITIDESYKPVLQQAITVFTASYPRVKIMPKYATYAECLRDLYNDSVRLVLLPGMPDKAAQEKIRERLGFKPAYGHLLRDAVAVILNKHIRDTLWDERGLRRLLEGKDSRFKVAFDGDETSSTLQYCMDSILRGAPLSDKVQGARHSLELIQYVQRTPNAIGFIGVSWIGDPEDSLQMRFLSALQVASLQMRTDTHLYVKPYQANIALLRYPLTRHLYYVLKENFSGPARGFVNFLSHERGQLLFKRAYLMPTRMDFSVRKVRINPR